MNPIIDSRSINEHFIIEIRRNDDSIVYWTEQLKLATCTHDVKKAKQYKDYNEAKKKALQIMEMNRVVTSIVKYTTTLEIKHMDVIEPFESPNKLTFWDYIYTIDREKEYDKWRLAMDIGYEYHSKAKDPDKFIDEIIQKVEQKFKKK